MGWQRWLISDVTSVQPILSLNGWMSLQRMKDLGYFNASSVVPLERKT
jgi:hypothetical protein